MGFWECREPSSYLDAEVTLTQKRLFNPSLRHTLRGFTSYDCKGTAAAEKIAKRRLDVVSGSIASYSRCLNDSSRLAAIKEMYEMTAAIAEISEDKERAKKRLLDEATAAAAEKAAKKKREAEEEEAKTLELQPELEALMEPYFAGEKTPADFHEFTVPQLKNLIRYFYQQRPVGLGTMSKPVLVDTLTQLYEQPHA